MKKLLTVMAAAIIVLASACSKSPTDAAPSASSWKLGSTTYTVSFSHRAPVSASTPSTLFIFADKTPVGADPTVNSVNISFQTVPAASGTYKLVRFGTAAAANEFEMSAGGDSKAYAYLGMTPVDVMVTINGGKATFKIPEVPMTSTSASIPNTTLTAEITEL